MALPTEQTELNRYVIVDFQEGDSKEPAIVLLSWLCDDNKSVMWPPTSSSYNKYIIKKAVPGQNWLKYDVIKIYWKLATSDYKVALQHLCNSEQTSSEEMLLQMFEEQQDPKKRKYRHLKMYTEDESDESNKDKIVVKKIKTEQTAAHNVGSLINSLPQLLTAQQTTVDNTVENEGPQTTTQETNEIQPADLNGTGSEEDKNEFAGNESPRKTSAETEDKIDTEKDNLVYPPPEASNDSVNKNDYPLNLKKNVKNGKPTIISNQELYPRFDLRKLKAAKVKTNPSEKSTPVLPKDADLSGTGSEEDEDDLAGNESPRKTSAETENKIDTEKDNLVYSPPEASNNSVNKDNDPFNPEETGENKKPMIISDKKLDHPFDERKGKAEKVNSNPSKKSTKDSAEDGINEEGNSADRLSRIKNKLSSVFETKESKYLKEITNNGAQVKPGLSPSKDTVFPGTSTENKSTDPEERPDDVIGGINHENENSPQTHHRRALKINTVANFVPENYVHLSQDEKLNVIGLLQHQSIANQAKLSIRLDMIEGAKKKKKSDDGALSHAEIQEFEKYLPITNPDGFKLFDNDLRDSEASRKDFWNYLQPLMSNINWKETVRSVLKKVMHDSLQCFYSNKGQKGKLAFNETYLYKIIEVAATRYPTHSHNRAKLKDFNAYISDYLKHAKDRLCIKEKENEAAKNGKKKKSNEKNDAAKNGKGKKSNEKKGKSLLKKKTEKNSALSLLDNQMNESDLSDDSISSEP